MAEYRVRVVRRRFEFDDGEPPWVAQLVARERDPFIDPIAVGRFATHREAVTRACTALRFVSAGIPWREGRSA